MVNKRDLWVTLIEEGDEYHPTLINLSNECQLNASVQMLCSIIRSEVSWLSDEVVRATTRKEKEGYLKMLKKQLQRLRNLLAIKDARESALFNLLFLSTSKLLENIAVFYTSLDVIVYPLGDLSNFDFLDDIYYRAVGDAIKYEKELNSLVGSIINEKERRDMGIIDTVFLAEEKVDITSASRALLFQSRGITYFSVNYSREVG